MAAEELDTGDDRASVYEDNGKIVYRASSFGGCTRALVALRSGYAPIDRVGEKMQSVFDAGHAAELVAIERLGTQGFNLNWAQKEYDLELTGKIVVRCHIDAMHFNHPKPGGTRPVEIKSQSQDAWDEFEKHGMELPLWKKYSWQFSAIHYAVGSEHPLLIVRINRDDPECPLALHDFTPDPDGLTKMRARALRIEALARRDELPECDPVSFPCPVFYLHEDVDRDLIESDDETIDALAVQYQQAGVEEGRWAKIKKAARDALRVGVDKKVRTKSGITVSFSTTTRRTWSDKKLVELLGDRVDEYKDAKDVEAIRVTMPKTGETND